MKKILLLISLILFIEIIQAQIKIKNDFYGIDQLVLQIPDSLTSSTSDISKYITSNFISDEVKVRAIFIWVSSNIEYDIENMFALNFYEKREDKILNSLKTKKGICESYASLFNEICIKSGLKSFVIEGYTKQNGFADYLSHAWCAAKIDSSWFMFDPTWGSGYIQDGKFKRMINNDFFQLNPSTLIKTHMPFDYLWQFLYYPITNQEFIEGKTQLNSNKKYFNYNDSIQLYEKQNKMEKLISSVYRIEKNGLKHALIFDRFQHLKLEIENEKQLKIANIFNSAVTDYNNGINNFNNFINYRNKQFMPIKTDFEIQNMIDTIDYNFNNAKNKISKINNADINTLNMINQLTKSIDDNIIQLTEQKNWIKNYFSKGKAARRSMFYVRLK